MEIIPRYNFLVLLLCTTSLAANRKGEQFIKDLQLGVEQFISSNQISNLSAVLEHVKDISDQELDASVKCELCEIVGNGMIFLKNTASDTVLKNFANAVCKAALGYGQEACAAMMDNWLPTIIYIIENTKPALTGRRICSIYMQSSKCEDLNTEKWEIPLPPLPESHDIIKPDYTTPATVNILHLTDFHYDPLYQNGSNAVCDQPLCCQTGSPSKPELAAGLWGDYHVCDMPKRTVENVLQVIGQKHLDTLDVVYFTGDIISHRFWDTTDESNAHTIEELFGYFAEAFKGKDVYPILGNHEPSPANFYAPLNIEKMSTKWLFDVSAKLWSQWLPEEATKTILKGGYYSVMTKQGYRIIALNSNVCYTNNFWLFYEDKDPYWQLSWLVEELYKAEKNKEKVHLLSHIPPGEPRCHRQWSNQFRKIIDRFAGTISAQFNGHTHVDEFRLFPNPQNISQVTSVAFNGGGFTTFVGFNPNYKIYQVETPTGVVKNYDQFIFNLTKANENSVPDWYKLYSFKEAYGLTDLSLRSFESLLDNLNKDDKLMYQYYEYLVKSSDVEIERGCDKKCLKQLLCYITAVESNESINC